MVALGDRRRLLRAGARLGGRDGRRRLGRRGRRQLRAAVVRRRRPGRRRAGGSVIAPVAAGAESGAAAAASSTRWPTSWPRSGASARRRQAAASPARRGGESGDSVDPLADVMADIRKAAAAAAAAAPAGGARAATLPLGGDKWGRDVLKKTIKGSETSIFVGLAAALRGDLPRHAVRRGRRLLRRLDRRRLQLVLQRVQLDSLPAADPRRRGGAAAEGHADDRPDPRAHRLDGHLPAGARRVPEAQGARVRAGRRRDRRVERAAHLRPHLPQREPRRAGAAVDPGRRLHQVRGDPLLPGLRRAGRRRVLGVDAERGAERADPGQVVAARRRGHGDGGAGHRVQPVHRRAARRAGSEAQGEDGARGSPQATPSVPHEGAGERSSRWSACATCACRSASTGTTVRGREGHQLRHPARRDRRAGRRVGQRQVGDLARHPRAAAAGERDRRRRQRDPLRRAQPRRPAAGASCARCAAPTSR